MKPLKTESQLKARFKEALSLLDEAAGNLYDAAAEIAAGAPGARVLAEIPGKLARYQEGIRMLEEAAENIYDAVKELRLAGIRESDIVDGRSSTPSKIAENLEALVEYLKTANRCDDCGELMTTHGPELECDPAAKEAWQKAGK